MPAFLLRAGSGIAFGYCHTREQWFVHVESTSNPNKDSQKIIRKLARIVDAPKNKKWVPTYKRNNNTDGGWNIDTNARTPAKLAKFMQSVWSSYQEINWICVLTDSDKLQGAIRNPFAFYFRYKGDSVGRYRR